MPKPARRLVRNESKRRNRSGRREEEREGCCLAGLEGMLGQRVLVRVRPTVLRAGWLTGAGPREVDEGVSSAPRAAEFSDARSRTGRAARCVVEAVLAAPARGAGRRRGARLAVDRRDPAEPDRQRLGLGQCRGSAARPCGAGERARTGRPFDPGRVDDASGGARGVRAHAARGREPGRRLPLPGRQLRRKHAHR